jgi:hypothetical protein
VRRYHKRTAAGAVKGHNCEAAYGSTGITDKEEQCMLIIEKLHKRTSLMSKKKNELVDHIMFLEHNNNVLNDTLNQQAENFKAIQSEQFQKLDKKSFKVDLGYTETLAVKLVDIEDELLNKL